MNYKYHLKEEKAPTYEELVALKNDSPYTFCQYKYDVEMAYLEGSEIEYYHAGNKAWEPATPPLFDWYTTMYRVKPQPKMVPLDFTDQLVGKVIVSVHAKWRHMILAQNANGPLVQGRTDIISYLQLMNDYTFLDGSKCEKEAV